MRLKKLMAKTMATTLATAMMVTPVLADPATPLTAPGAGDSLTVEGDTEYVDTLVYEVTIPTASSLTFKLDPNGLAGYFAKNDEATSVEDGADLDEFRGKIVGTGSDVIANESSVPILVTCSFHMTNTTGITLADKKDSEWDDTKNLVLLEVIADKATATDLTPAAATPTDNIVAITSTKAAEPTTISFALAKAEYKFKKESSGITYERTDTEIGDANKASFSLGGFVGKDADWKDISEATSKLTLNCVYKFEGLKEIGAGATDENTNVVVDAAGLTKLETGPATEITLSSAKGVAASTTVGAEGYDLKSVKLVNYTMNGTLNTYNQLATQGVQYSLAEDTFTVLSSMTSAWSACEFELTFEVQDAEDFVQTVKWAVATD